MTWEWLVPICLFGPFVWLLITMHIEDRQAKKYEDGD